MYVCMYTCMHSLCIYLCMHTHTYIRSCTQIYTRKQLVILLSCASHRWSHFHGEMHEEFASIHTYMHTYLVSLTDEATFMEKCMKNLTLKSIKGTVASKTRASCQPLTKAKTNLACMYVCMYACMHVCIKQLPAGWERAANIFCQTKTKMNPACKYVCVYMCERAAWERALNLWRW
jgi:hypothetical protein